jgi:integrase
MPRHAKWSREGTSASPKMIDVRLPGLGRLQVTSGVVHRSAYTLRVNAIREAWALGGLWADAVRALKAGRFDVAAFYEARSRGEAGVRHLLATAGSEPLATLVKDYLKQSKATDLVKMRQRLGRFQKALGKTPSVADLTPSAVERFLEGLTDARTAKTTKTAAKGSTVNRYRAVIGGLCTWAVKTGRMQTHPIAGKQVEKRAEPHHRLPELSADEYRDYMAAVRAARPDLAVVLLLLIHTAPDVGELLSEHGASARDADLETGRMRYERSKTKRFGPAPRFVPMPSIVLAEVRAHVAEHGLRGSQRLFSMVKRSDVEWLHDRAAQAIQRPELTLKDLRHVAAIAWVKAGVHIRLVMRWLGHRSLAMTMKYTDYEPGAEMAVEMAERAARTLNETSDVTPLKVAQ